uniref:Uncharacterized protein n=1 Tax=Lepeophtheirus salmonis TaxID=72036 RepID=A0A0K2VK56_LEPSM
MIKLEVSFFESLYLPLVLTLRQHKIPFLHEE